MQEVETLLRDLADRRVELWEEHGNLRYRGPADALTPEIRSRLVASRAALIAVLRPSKPAQSKSEQERLPLTDLQRAYWLAECEAGGGTPGYWYEQYAVGALDVDRLESAFRRLVERHDALRIVVDEDGMQRVLRSVPAFQVAREDLRGLPAEEAERRIELARERCSRPRSTLDRWPLIDVLAQRLDDGYRVHVGGRFIVLDGFAWDQMCEELTRLYAEPTADLPPLQQSYAGAVLEEDAERNGAAYRTSLERWLSRSLPPPPELPVRRDFDSDAPRRFSRLRHRIEREECARLRHNAAARGLTLNGVLCAAYAEVIGHFAAQPRFTLNLLLTNPRHVRSGRWPLSNSATTLLLEVDLRRHSTFRERAVDLQVRLSEDVQHSRVSGVVVAREQAKARGLAPQPNPVVFASTLGMSLGKGTAYGLERLGWQALGSYVQTPHVLLDQQMFERDGAIAFNWDFVEPAFEPGVVPAMFGAYCDLIQRLARDESSFDSAVTVHLPESQRHVRRVRNASSSAPASGRLDDFARSISGDAVVIADGVGELRRAELVSRAAGVAKELVERGVTRGQLVPVIAEKGRNQVIGALGVQLAGAAYVPIETATPERRLTALLAEISPPLVLCDGRAHRPETASVPWIDLERLPGAELAPPRGSADDLAYVIFTSGSTGVPKGAAISHRAARNTIDDMLVRWPLSPNDAVLAVSQFSFDLSVFDVFGLLAAGGRIVIPREDERRDAARWCELILSQRVTVWNSVPALMDMLVEYAELHSLSLPLELVLLSGDWVPTTLPARVRKVAPRARVIALGGATEASIWSNYFDTEQLDPSWSSVPYGYPLARQSLHVLDDRLQDRPDFCEGDLYIGGDGVALGYFGDAERTAQSFLVHPSTSERLYRTGDRARYWPDGTVEFLGRRDAQVKIRGHRVELGEIEAALQSFPGVRAAAALASASRRSLAACVVASFDVDARRAELERHLRERLPEHMLPSTFRNVARIPLSANGKVDRKELAQLFVEPAVRPTGRAEELAPAERRIQDAFREVLGHDNFGAHDSFFEVGGDSIGVARVLNVIERSQGKRLPLSTVLASPTVAGLAAALERLDSAKPDGLVHEFCDVENGAFVCFVHPIGGTLLGYRALASELAGSGRICGVSAAGTGNEEPDRSVSAMAERYLGLIGPRRRRSNKFVLVGWSFGGVIALEMARRLRDAGENVELVVIDPWVRLASGITIPNDELRADFARSTADANPGSEVLAHPFSPSLERLFRVYAANAAALLEYDAPDVELACELVVGSRTPPQPFTGLQPIQRSREWRLAANVTVLDAGHYDIMLPPHTHVVSQIVSRLLRRPSRE